MGGLDDTASVSKTMRPQQGSIFMFTFKPRPPALAASRGFCERNALKLLAVGFLLSGMARSLARSNWRFQIDQPHPKTAARQGRRNRHKFIRLYRYDIQPLQPLKVSAVVAQQDKTLCLLPASLAS